MFLPRGQIFLGNIREQFVFQGQQGPFLLGKVISEAHSASSESPHIMSNPCGNVKAWDISLLECQTSSGIITTQRMYEHLVALTHMVSSDYRVSSLHQISGLAPCRGCRGGKELLSNNSCLE